MLNPYIGHSFFEVIALFFTRLCTLQTFFEPTSDEIQIGVLVLIGISAALLGTFLVLKKMTMLANSLSHTILLGIVLAVVFTKGMMGSGGFLNIQVLLIASFLAALLTTVLTQFFHQVLRLAEDASIGLVFSALFALGVICVTALTRNMHIGVEAVTGNVDALHINDLRIAFYVTLANALIVLLCFKEYTMIAFDRSYARIGGFSPNVFNYLLMMQVAASAVSAFRAIGVLLFLAFLTGPVLTARLYTNKLRTLISLSIVFACIAALISVALSRHLLSVHSIAVSTAGLTVVCIGLFYATSLIIRSWGIGTIKRKGAMAQRKS